MMHALSLESFDQKHADETETNEAFQEGLLAGIAQARVEAEAAQDVLRTEFIQTVSDLHFTYVEARAAFVSSIKPLLTAIPQAVLPPCINAAYAMQVAQLLTEAAESCASKTMAITVHPSAFAAVQEAIAASNLDVKVDQDTALSPHAMWVGRTSGEALFDLDALAGQITEILSAVAEFEEARKSNG